jgi:hypothetical protein
MGRHKKQVEVQAQVIEKTETEVILNEPEVEVISEPIMDKEVDVEPVNKVAELNNDLELKRRIKELEVKLQEKVNEGGIDELVKRPDFGTKMYLHLRMENLQDPKNPNQYIPIVAMISAFPNLLDHSELDPVTKKPKFSAPDINVDRALGDRIRETDADFFEFGIGFDSKPRKINLLTEYNGKVMRVKQAIRLMQTEYLRRKKEGDELHKFEMDKITRASA